MEKLQYIIDDRTIADILGVQNFSTKESAILELIKNSYDAGATDIEIKISKEEIVFKDNGFGMSAEDIKNVWMHVGYSEKKYEFNAINHETRISAGSKGIGRFALSRLGKSVILYSKKKDCKGIKWFTDWNINSLNIEENICKGTTIILKELRDNWNEKSIDSLKSFLSRACDCEDMKIRIYFGNKIYEVKNLFFNGKLGINYLSYFTLRFDSTNCVLFCDVYNDEFLDKAQIKCKKFNINELHTESNLSNNLNINDLEISENELKNYLNKLGDFSANLYFSLKGTSTEDVERFMYKHQILSDRFIDGIILYRNSFSISSYEGKKDWLELGKRARKSPAAASHPTGTWRVRDNQLSGFVLIDKQRNANLKELSNRQGLEEDTFYKLFIKIIQEGIGIFENYRQQIIRDIIKDNKKVDDFTKKIPIINDVLKNKIRLSDLKESDEIRLKEEIKILKDETSKQKDNTDIVEKRYKYDVRILNVLSTIGLRASSIAHEMNNQKSFLKVVYDYIVRALKKYNVRDILNTKEHTKYEFENVPVLLQRNNDINEKIVHFIETMLTNIEQSQFVPKELDLFSVISDLKDDWVSEYSWVHINIIGEHIIFNTAEDVVKVILDNLILNSIQQNDSSNNLEIVINLSAVKNGIIIRYKDNGVGLNEKYRNNPYKILEVHETSRKDGHGLGMWIINNTLSMTGGKVVDIPITNGFEIELLLGGEL